MSECIRNCKLCDKFVISQAVTFADGVLTSVNSYDAKTENLYFALTNFGYGMDITNYYGTTDKADVAIASTLAKIHTPTAIVLDGVANDDAFNYANNTLEVKGINNIDIKAHLWILDIINCIDSTCITNNLIPFFF